MSDIESQRIESPWSDEQVAGLQRWQSYGFVHEFTCLNGHGALVPTKAGWTCPHCIYTQNWAWDFMFQPQRNPLERQ